MDLRLAKKEDLKNIYKLREIIFQVEQGVAKHIDFDGKDEKLRHYVLYIDNNLVGTGRINPKKDSIKIERVCVLKEYRGRGYGKKIINFILEDVKNNFKDFKKVILSSQLSAIDFYKNLGFKTYGEKFLEAGIEHIKMLKIL
jgi:predicted GNAT family N-acyltransferase